MTGRAILTTKTLEDLREIADRIGRDSVDAADATILRILAAIDVAAEMPTASAIVAEFDDPNVRQVRVHDYRIVFLVLRDAIRVMAVVHGSRDALPILARRL